MGATLLCVGKDDVSDFNAFHDRTNDEASVGCACDLLMYNSRDLRKKLYVERNAALRKLLHDYPGIQYVEHAEGHGDKLFEAVCKLGLEGIVSKKLDAPYPSGPSKAWIKVKNPKAAAATRAADGTF
jgi:bifunctional non-homologous end joining protein LigD